MQQRIPLAAIAPGETVRVAEIRVEGALRRRLFDLGLIPQTLISCRFAAPAGSPMAFTVRGAAIALRTRDAQEIFVERVS
ncbi:MAG: FeoA family protein [Oscillospiraceae bacterium]